MPSTYDVSLEEKGDTAFHWWAPIVIAGRGTCLIIVVDKTFSHFDNFFCFTLHLAIFLAAMKRAIRQDTG